MMIEGGEWMKSLKACEWGEKRKRTGRRQVIQGKKRGSETSRGEREQMIGKWKEMKEKVSRENHDRRETSGREMVNDSKCYRADKQDGHWQEKSRFVI